MKTEELMDWAIDFSKKPVVIEMPDGKQMTTSHCKYGYTAKGDLVLIVFAGRKMK